MSDEPIFVRHHRVKSKLGGDWRISGCTVHDSNNKERYCINSCKIKEHCTVYIALMGKREKVQFT